MLEDFFFFFKEKNNKKNTPQDQIKGEQWGKIVYGDKLEWPNFVFLWAVPVSHFVLFPVFPDK